MNYHSFSMFLGDMSFVGTRPEVQKYVDKYTDEMLATLLPAGVTSLASIEYKDEDDIIGRYTAKECLLMRHMFSMFFLRK